MLDKYLILLSTFNGEKYLGELLESLIKQENAQCTVIVRDDGSTDGTLQILDSFKAVLHMEIHVGENIGPDASFKLLMNLAQNRKFDYLAFCDQDDVWEPTKLKRASQSLTATGKSLYSSKRKLIDKNGRLIGIFPSSKILVSYESSIVENVCAGCTIVLKHELFSQLMKFGLPKIKGRYDHIIYSMSTVLDETFFDQESRLFYRIHASNTVGVRKSFIRSIKEASSELLAKIETSIQIQRSMSNQMTGKQRATLEAITAYSNMYRRSLGFLKMPKLRQNRLEDLIIKVYLTLNQRKITSKL
jgi:glycosyltransferase involved in cell wall biosynthesis